MCQIYDLWWVNYCTITTKSKAPRPLPPPLFLISSALMHLFRDKWAEPGGVEDWGYFRCRLPGFGDRCDHHLYLQMSWQKQVGSAVFFFSVHIFSFGKACFESRLTAQTFLVELKVQSRCPLLISALLLASIISCSLPSIDIIWERLSYIVPMQK